MFIPAMNRSSFRDLVSSAPSIQFPMECNRDSCYLFSIKEMTTAFTTSAVFVPFLCALQQFETVLTLDAQKNS